MLQTSASQLRSGTSVLGGIALMLAGVALFSFNDALGKWLLGTYSVGQILLLRSGFSLLLLAPLLWRAGLAAFRDAPRPGMQILRVLLSTTEVVMFFWAVTYLPLADAVTFYLAGPIYVTALSAVLLREEVGWRRWSAVLIGFVGVLIALRPSPATFTLPSLIALTGSFFYALLMITTRSLRATPNLVLSSAQIGMTFLFGAIAAPLTWKTPPLNDVALLALFGATAMVALSCVNWSLKLAPASVVVPYQYTMIVWAVLLGYAFFGDVPDLATLVGSGIIILAGLFIFWRERVHARTVATAVPPPA
jgi:drug/metabolite transporter (DMT)-like permease